MTPGPFSPLPQKWGGGGQQHLSKSVTSVQALTHGYLGGNVCAFPSRGPHLSRRGKLNTSPVNKVMLYLCGSQATETFCSPARIQAGGSCLPSSLFLTRVGVSETLLGHNRRSDDGMSGVKAAIAGLCVCKKCKTKNKTQSSFVIFLQR